MILVWGSTTDEPVAAVLDALEDRSATVAHLEDEALQSLPESLGRLAPV